MLDRRQLLIHGALGLAATARAAAAADGGGPPSTPATPAELDEALRQVRAVAGG